MARPEDFVAKPLAEEAARSWTLPGSFYSDPAVFEAEKRRIFYQAWQLVAHRSQLKTKGDYVCARIVDEEVFVIRGADGQLRGFYNVCQHRAHGLLQGSGRVRAAIVCPYHAWAYDLDGSLRSARETDGLPEFDAAGFCLTPVRVEEAAGFVFVNLDPEATSFAEQFGDMIEDMRANVPWLDEVEVQGGMDLGDWGGSELKANWKVLAENCLECYHCQPAHPALVDMIDMGSYRCTPHGEWLKSYGEISKRENKAYPIGKEEPSQLAVFWHIWPNIEFSVMPGEAALGAFRFTPSGPETTITSGLLLTRPGESVRPERQNYRWNVLWPEDEAICESVHRGLKSRGYAQGRFVCPPGNQGVSEAGVHHFQKLYSAALSE